MNDDEIHVTIGKLVAEERDLRAAEASDEERARLKSIEEALDQCWDLLRQRDALRDAGADPDKARTRSVAEDEGYLQ